LVIAGSELVALEPFGAKPAYRVAIVPTEATTMPSFAKVRLRERRSGDS
jgi:hypothetical protein